MPRVPGPAARGRHGFFPASAYEPRLLAAETEGLYSVDCNAPFCDGDGYLLPDVSAGGERLTPEYTTHRAHGIPRQAVTERSEIPGPPKNRSGDRGRLEGRGWNEETVYVNDGPPPCRWIKHSTLPLNQP